jgi:proteasome beta subunit
MKHMKNFPYQKPKMTTALAIKCNEGIVLASDTQGTLKDIKIEVTKIYKINNSMGLVGAGYEEQITELVEHLQKYLGDEKFLSELTLRNRINESLTNIHAIKNVIGSNRSGYQNTQLLFHPTVLIGAKLDNGLYCLYDIAFGPFGDNGVFTVGIVPVNDYRALGSGAKFATFIIKQQNRICALDKLNINVGIASYTIKETKDIDLYSGLNTQVVIIDKNGYKEITQEEQEEYYNKMIDNTYNLLYEQTSEGNKLENLKRIFPYN